MNFRASVCASLSKRLLPPPMKRTVDYQAYVGWRDESLSRSWSSFSDAHIAGKDVLDFGCGDGSLSFFLAADKQPRSILGVDINAAGIARAKGRLAEFALPAGVRLDFKLGSTDGLPVAEQSVDTLVAFDCLEHVMSPLPIFQDWYRVLRPGGRCLIEWFPYKGPWGPHMESLIPIPWAHVIFGQEAMLRAAEHVYDSPQFVPRHWDLDENGHKKPNKWKAWSSFKEQGYINELDMRGFEALVRQSGLRIDRFDKRSFSGSPLRQKLGHALMQMPVVGEYFLSYAVIELVR